jgi:hypothetical protein
MSSRQRPFYARRSTRNRLVYLTPDCLEKRLVLSAIQPIFREFHAPSTYPQGDVPSRVGILPFDNGTTTPVGYSPQQLQIAYGLTHITFGGSNGTPGNGTGQTIAIVDAYDDPSFLDSTDPNFSTSDLAQFDVTLGYRILRVSPSTIRMEDPACRAQILLELVILRATGKSRKRSMSSGLMPLPREPPTATRSR